MYNLGIFPLNFEYLKGHRVSHMLKLFGINTPSLSIKKIRSMLFIKTAILGIKSPKVIVMSFTSKIPTISRNSISNWRGLTISIFIKSFGVSEWRSNLLGNIYHFYKNISYLIKAFTFDDPFKWLVEGFVDDVRNLVCNESYIDFKLFLGWVCNLSVNDFVSKDRHMRLDFIYTLWCLQAFSSAQLFGL